MIMGHMYLKVPYWISVKKTVPLPKRSLLEADALSSLEPCKPLEIKLPWFLHAFKNDE